MLKSSAIRKLYSIFFVLILIFIQGCSDPESSARKLYNEGMTLQQEGNNEQAIVIYKELVSSYPDTETAVEVNKILLSINVIQNVTENIKAETKRVITRGNQVIKEDIRASLDSSHP